MKCSDPMHRHTADVSPADELRARFIQPDSNRLLDEALAAEHGATVERIRSRLMTATRSGQIPIGKHPRIEYLDTILLRNVTNILDEEAAR